MKYLNLGCGERFHAAWINVDFISTGPDVIVHNLSQGIPFPDSSFDVVYHSHLLEHFPKADSGTFLKECYRVIRPQGTLRIAVPDLEQIVRCYLLTLEKVFLGAKNADHDYNWLLLEMFDQMVRNQSGGEMASYLHQSEIPNVPFILKRLGTEAIHLIESGQTTSSVSNMPNSFLKRTFRAVYHLCRNPCQLRDVLLKNLLGASEYQALQIGRFRQSGEIHQWMYDRYSLKCLLEQFGFRDIQQCSAYESRIPQWTSFNLDTEPDGSVYKPDSLYMEATKPI